MSRGRLSDFIQLTTTM